MIVTKFNKERINFKTAVPTGSSVVLYEAELPSVSIQVTKGYYGFTGKMTYLVIMDFADGSHSSNSFIDSPEGEKRLIKNIEMIFEMDGELAKKVLEIYKLRNQIKPLEEKISEAQQKMFQLVEGQWNEKKDGYGE